MAQQDARPRRRAGGRPKKAEEERRIVAYRCRANEAEQREILGLARTFQVTEADLLRLGLKALKVEAGRAKASGECPCMLRRRLEAA